MKFPNEQMESAKKSLRDEFGNVLVDLGSKNKILVVLDADLSSSTRTNKFSQNFPDRFFNIGIAEQNMMGIAIGLANSGKIPIVSGFTNFTIGRAWEFIKAAAYDNLPILICTSHAGLGADRDGGSHQAIEDVSLISAIPNTKVYSPCDPLELRKILEFEIQNIQKDPKVTYIRLMRSAFPWVFKNISQSVSQPVMISESDESDVDITLFTTGSMTCFTPQIISIIHNKRKNVKYRVIHCGQIKPISENHLLKFAINTKKIVTLEEHNVIAGFGAQISRIISRKHPKPILILGIEDRPGQSGLIDELFKEYGLDPESIAEKILDFLME